MNDGLNACVRDATKELLESTLGEPVKASPAVAAQANGKPYETSVVISFVGGLSGAFVLRCSKRLAALLASRMLGSEVAEGSEDMKDAIGEFFNMVVGAAKTRLPSGAESFRISVPTTILGEKYVLHIKANETDTLALLEFAVGAETLSVEVYVK